MSDPIAGRLPEEPQTDAAIPSGWFTSFYRAVKAFMAAPVVGDGRTIKVVGRTISAMEPPDRRQRRWGIAVFSAAKVADIYVDDATSEVLTDQACEIFDDESYSLGHAYPAAILMHAGVPKWTAIAGSGDRYVAVNSLDSPDYLEDQFSPMTTEQSPSGTDGNVKFQVIDVSGDKKISANVQTDPAYPVEDGANGLTVKVKNSVEIDVAAGVGAIQLDGDAASPGNSKYYGTSGAGAKGFHDLPTVIDDTVGGWGDLVNPPVKILGKDASGNVGWVGVCQPVSEIEGGTP